MRAVLQTSINVAAVLTALTDRLRG
jgi:hypothetical protein